MDDGDDGVREEVDDGDDDDNDSRSYYRRGSDS
jgi:hypothetical protein